LHAQLKICMPLLRTILLRNDPRAVASCLATHAYKHNDVRLAAWHERPRDTTRKLEVAGSTPAVREQGCLVLTGRTAAMQLLLTPTL